jgi:hypothetical protein
MTHQDLEWVKSSFSDSSNCLEWAHDSDHDCIHFRDSKDDDRVTVTVSIDDWRVFIQAAKAGEADY